jgi:hypothetical protein
MTGGGQDANDKTKRAKRLRSGNSKGKRTNATGAVGKSQLLHKRRWEKLVGMLGEGHKENS